MHTHNASTCYFLLISSITCLELFSRALHLRLMFNLGLGKHHANGLCLPFPPPSFPQVVSAIPVHLDGKSAPGQAPTGSVCYERNGVSGSRGAFQKILLCAPGNASVSILITNKVKVCCRNIKHILDTRIESLLLKLLHCTLTWPVGQK